MMSKTLGLQTGSFIGDKLLSLDYRVRLSCEKLSEVRDACQSRSHVWGGDGDWYRTLLYLWTLITVSNLLRLGFFESGWLLRRFQT